MKILHLDIETAPNEGYFWDPKTRFIPADRITQTSRVLCFAHLWHGEKQVQFLSEWTDDYMIPKAWELLSEADAVVTYNGNKFDLPVLNREFLLHSLPPAEPYHSIDLYRTVKREFKFTHSGLGAVCKELGLGSKISHPGFQMWVDVMNGDERMRKAMERYNKQDVKLLPKLYKFLTPWIRNHPNHALFMDTDRPVCPNCGSHKMTRQGFKKTKTQIYQQYKCGDCGSWSRDRYTVVPPEKRHTILTGG